MEKLKPKLFSVMKTYTKEQFVKDVIAGIIVAIIALPLSIALALASGVNPERGLYTAIVAGFIIAFLEEAVCRFQDRPQPLQRLLRELWHLMESKALLLQPLWQEFFPDSDGCAPPWRVDPFHSLYDYNRIYSRNCRNNCHRTGEGLPGTSV